MTFDNWRTKLHLWTEYNEQKEKMEHLCVTTSLHVKMSQRVETLEKYYVEFDVEVAGCYDTALNHVLIKITLNYFYTFAPQMLHYSHADESVALFYTRRKTCLFVC